MIDNTNKEFYCAMPWHGAFYTNNGMGPCCSWVDLQKTTPIKFLESDYLRQVKVDMLNGTVPAQCKYCYEQEQNGFHSTRNLYTNHFVSQGWMEPSRSLEVRTPEVLEIRFSNLCNMQCRICSPDWSHLIGREVQESNNQVLKRFYKASGQKIEEDPLKEMSNESVQEITELAKKARHVFFTGGEPTIHKQTIRLIETLVESGCSKNQILQFSTNTSAINPNLIEKFKEFDKVILSLSIDAVGEVANYQRYGTNWEVVDKNVYSLGDLKNSSSVLFGDDVTQSVVHSVRLGINMAISAYTVLDIDTTMKWFVDVWNHCKLTLNIAVVHYPFHAILLRGKCRQLAAKKLQSAIEILENKVKQDPSFVLYLKNTSDSLQELRKLHQTLNEPEDSSSQAVSYYKDWFYLPTLALDQIRNQSFEQLFGIPLDPPG